MHGARSPRQLSTPKKIAYAFVVNFLVFAVLFFSAELVVRWYVVGGVVRAFASFWTPLKATGLVRDPDLGFRLNPAQPGVNSIGLLHGEISPVKPSGLFRVIVLGDSVAYDYSGFVRMITEEFHTIRKGPVEVINASIPGFTTYQELTLLKRDLIALNPDLVILQYCLNDNYRFLHYLDDSGRWLITAEAERAVGSNNTGPLAALAKSSYLLMMFRVGLLQSEILTGTPFVWENRADFSAAWKDASWAENEKHLTEMKTLLEAEGAAFMVVVVPFGPQLSSEALDKDREYTLKPQAHLMEIFDRLDRPILDLFPAFLKHLGEDLYRDAIHLTEHGHRLVADELLAFLDENGLAATQASRP